MSLRDKFVPPPEIYDALKDITVKDVTILSEDDMVELVPTSLQKLKMKLYCRKNLAKILNSYERTEEEYTCTLEGTKTDPTELCVEFTSSIIVNNGMSIEYIVSYIEKEIPDPKIIKTLNFHRQHLFDCDLEYISKATNVLPNLDLVILQSTRLKGSTVSFRAIKEMLDKGIVVDIMVTPMASIECRQFFDSLTYDQHSKLIWIGECWLYKDEWHKVFTDEDPIRNEKIENAHAKYYLVKKPSSW